MNNLKDVVNDLIQVGLVDLTRELERITKKIDNTPQDKMHIRALEVQMALKKFMPGHPSEFKDNHIKIGSIWGSSGWASI